MEPTRLRLRVSPGAGVVSGHSGRDKIVEPAGLGPAQIEQRQVAAAGKERRA
jgi:hypothetical protein